MIEKRVVRSHVPPGSYCNIDVLRNAKKKSEQSQLDVYSKASDLLSLGRQGHKAAVDKLLHEADISQIYGGFVS